MMEDAVTHQIALGVAATYLLQFLKNCPWAPWFSHNSDTINKTFSALIAFLSSVGIQAVMTGHLSMETGATITLTIPSLSIIIDTLMHTMAQWGIQQGIYHGIVKPNEAKPALGQAASGNG